MSKFIRKYFLIIGLVVTVGIIVFVTIPKVIGLIIQDNYNTSTEIKWDGKLNKKTKHGYTLYKFLDKKYTGFNAETICPAGTKLPEIDDLIALYCETKGPNASYQIGSTGKSKSCSGYTHNNILASNIKAIYGNKQVDFWSSSHYYNNDKEDDGMWAITIFSRGNDSIFVNIPDAEYNIVCLGKNKEKQEIPLYKKVGTKKKCFETWQAVVVEGYYTGNPPKECSKKDYDLLYEYCEKHEDECSHYVGNIIYEINKK